MALAARVCQDGSSARMHVQRERVVLSGHHVASTSGRVCSKTSTVWGMDSMRRPVKTSATVAVPAPQSALPLPGTAAGRVQGVKYDVYVNDPVPLAEGVEKHIISIFVADEPGLINRVAGVFARRGYNIESLAVGLTKDKALFTIVVTGTPTIVSNLVKQLSKLVKVRYVQDITSVERVERELLLIKVAAAPGPTRTEVLQLAEIFRARTVDVSDTTISLCVSGDTGKCLALQKSLSKFVAVEIVRTGRVCLLRGEKMMEQLQGAEGQRRLAPKPAAADATPFTAEERGADVYAVDDETWDAQNNVLEPVYAAEEELSADVVPHTLSVEVQDTPGVLNMVTGVFARRGFSIQSLAVGPSEKPGMSRITMVVAGSPAGVAKHVKQLNRLISVQQVQDLTFTPFVNRELMLVKVRCSSAHRGELRDLIDIFRGSIIDVSNSTVTVEVLGKVDKMKALTDLLEPFGILEVVRTGRVALSRDSGVNSEYLERMSTGRIW